MKELKSTILAATNARNLTKYKTSPALQNVGIKSIFATFFLVAYAFTASAQKSTVLDAFSKHGIDVSVLDSKTLQQPEDYSYDLKFTSAAAGKQTVTVAKFEPSNIAEERWVVVSVDGKSPSKSEINTFRKNHNKPQNAPLLADDSSYRIEKETPDYLVISYKQDVASIPKDAAFMKDCRSYLTVNLKSKRVEQVQAINEKTLRIKILNAEKFELTVKYTWNEQAKRYFTANESVTMLAKFLGQSTNVETVSEYSNFTKK